MIASQPEPVSLSASMQVGRLQWAYRAYRRFIGELSEDVRAHLTHSTIDQEPYVVVFGKTQVGKTTLLLELMGLDAEAQVRVGKVLRGGREFGKSATATTMEYRRSPDRNWYLDDGAGAHCIMTDDEMCKALGDLRQKMSNRRLVAEKPVVVSIPEECFGHGTEAGIGARMLDLPGDNPADEVEREHVERMAQRYVPHADLILLVGRGDDLSFLNPDALTLPSIEDWQFVPNRFRIVTTYSFTPHTVQQFARNHKGELNADQFRERLLEQIRTFGLTLSPEAEQVTRYFPLEFGQSWHAMLRNDKEFAHRVEPVVNALKAQLHEDIRASASEVSRFRNALDVHFVAKRKRAACLDQGQAALADLRRRIDMTQKKEQQARDGDKTATEQFNAVRTLLTRRDQMAEKISSLTFDASDQISEVGGVRENTSSLFARIDDFTSWLRQSFLDTPETVLSSTEERKFFANSRPNLTAHIDKINRIADEEFAVLRRRMSGYWKKEYYPSVSDSFSSDKTRLRLDIRDAALKAAELCKTLWRDHFDARVSELQAQAAEADSARIGMRQIAAQQQAEMKKLAMRCDEVQAVMERGMARLDRDARTAARFGTMLDEEYLEELRQRRVQFATAARPVDAMPILLSVASMREERSMIKLS